jgi:HAD superfamily hydrolase (TIGR01549 family)
MKAVIFDYNGILVNDLNLHEQAYLEVAKRHGKKLDIAELRKTMSKTTIEKIIMIAGTDDKEVIERLLKEKEDLYFELARRGVLFPKTEDVINSLYKRYTLAITTNSNRRQFYTVFPDELIKKFKIIYTYEDIKNPKPAPDSILDIMGELGVEKHEACYVGDTPSDMYAAKNAGILAIGIPTGTDTKEQLIEAGADIILNSLDELEKQLESR